MWSGHNRGREPPEQRLANEVLPQHLGLLRGIAEAPSPSPQEELKRKKPNRCCDHRKATPSKNLGSEEPLAPKIFT